MPDDSWTSWLALAIEALEAGNGQLWQRAAIGHLDVPATSERDTAAIIVDIFAYCVICICERNMTCLPIGLRR
jgi:hypothetical protein